MRIGVPTEIKRNEGRVGLVPTGVRQLVQAGHTVYIQAGAGQISGIADTVYQAAGAVLCATASQVYGQADLIVKVKEPIAAEYDLLQPGQLLFTYLHLAAEPELLRCLQSKKITAVAYETVQLPDGRLPLLQPMSLIAGKMSVQIAAHFLEHHRGGKGLLLSYVPGLPKAEVVIIGGGIVGCAAAQVALGMGANVTLLERSLQRIEWLEHRFGQQLQLLVAHPSHIEQAVAQADVLIGAVLIPGDKAPRLVSAAQISSMAAGGVIIDVAVDQGGCIETIRPTTHSNPTYVEAGIVHYGVTNMPGAVPQTSTYALTNATLPYILQLAGLGAKQAAQQDGSLALGLNVFAGQICHPGLAKAMTLPYVPVAELS